MAKKKSKKKTDDDIFNELASEFGGEVVANAETVTYYIDTGNLAMNFVCSGRFIGGGIPGGRITEFYGPSASAKSLWGMTILGGTQKADGYAILLDTENALNPDFAERAGHIDLNRLIRYTPETLERAFAKITNVIRKIREVKGPDVPICVVYDSITVSPCERELRETDLGEEYNDAEWKRVVGAKEQPGERAKIIGKELRKLTPILQKENATLFIINQTRMQIGVMYGNPEITPGGKSLEFYASCRVRTSAHKKIEDKELKKPLGVNIKVANKKNRSNTPFLEIPTSTNEGGIPLYFDRGIDPTGGLLTALIQSERITPGTGGNYEVKPEYAGSENVKFKSALSRNTIPMELLFEHPKLVDADDADQVRKYFSDFEEAIALTNSDKTVEVAVVDQNEDLMK